MSGMHGLCHVLQFIVNGLNNRPLPEHDLVIDGHQPVLHVAPESRHEVYPVGEEAGKEGFGDVSFVRIDLSQHVVSQPIEHLLVAVVNVRPGQHEIDELTFLVANEMQLESVEPAHRTLAYLRIALEHLVALDAFVVADRNACTVDEANARALSETEQLEEQGHLDCYARLQFHETVVRHSLREAVPQITLHVARSPSRRQFCWPW